MRSLCCIIFLWIKNFRENPIVLYYISVIASLNCCPKINRVTEPRNHHHKVLTGNMKLCLTEFSQALNLWFGGYWSSHTFISLHMWETICDALTNLLHSKLHTVSKFCREPLSEMLVQSTGVEMKIIRDVEQIGRCGHFDFQWFRVPPRPPEVELYMGTKFYIP